MYAGAFGGQEILALNGGIKWQIAFVMAAKMTVTAHLIGCIVVRWGCSLGSYPIQI